MLSSWRIVKRRYAENACDGEGARRTGGRWNSPGTAMVYTAATESLAILELLVHLERTRILSSYVVIECRFAPEMVIHLERGILPKQWRNARQAAAVRFLGDQWIRLGNSAVLAVPSAVVPRELIYLLNPAHPQFGNITIGKPEPLELDSRL